MSSHAVKVAVKIRPLNRREISQNQRECTVIQDASDGLKSVHLGDGRCFTYDYVIDHTEKAFNFYNNCVSNLVEGLFNGYNATVLAYGQTGSGKTYTMGTSSKINETSEETLGVVPRAAVEIFQKIDHIKSVHTSAEIFVKTQFLELYQDSLVDLYNHKNTTPLKITQNPLKGVTVASKFEPVTTAEETMDKLQKAALNRQVGGTLMNSESSRSHAVFTIHIHQNFPANNSDAKDEGKNIHAKFCLVDLAGSERIGKTGAEGERKQEGIGINQGLFALGNVISSLGTPKKGIPVNYRDSKLTLLLKDSLGGNSRTLMIACISPSAGELNETKSTLDYANRARNIRNIIKVNQDESSSVLYRCRERIKELEKMLKMCTCGLISHHLLKDPEVTKEANLLETNDSVSLHCNDLKPNIVTCTSISQKEGHHFMNTQDLGKDIELLQRNNEELQDTVEYFQNLKPHLSHQLSNWKLYSELTNLKLEAIDESDYQKSLRQKLMDYVLLNGELEAELERRKKYYSISEECRKKRDRFRVHENTSSSYSNSLHVDDILSLSKQDVERREEFYKSLPEYIVKPKLKKKRRRKQLRKQSGLLRLDEMYPYIQQGDVVDISESASEISIKMLNGKMNRGHMTKKLTHSEVQDSKLEIAPLKRMEVNKHRSEAKKSLLVDRKLENPVENDLKLDFEESPLYNESDYDSASGPVLNMMREMEVKDQQTKAKKKLKEKEELLKNANIAPCIGGFQEQGSIQNSLTESEFGSGLLSNELVSQNTIMVDVPGRKDEIKDKISNIPTTSISITHNMNESDQFLGCECVVRSKNGIFPVRKKNSTSSNETVDSRVLFAPNDVYNFELMTNSSQINSMGNDSLMHNTPNIYETSVDNGNKTNVFDSTLPEEDQASQMMKEIISDNASHHSELNTVNENFQEPNIYRNTFSSLRKQSSYFSSGYYYDSETSDDNEDGISNTHVLNPDVEILISDTKIRKDQIAVLKRERENSIKLKKQMSGRIKELEVKLVNTEQDRDKCVSSYNAIQSKLKQADSKRIIADYEKKVNSIKTVLNEEKKKTRKMDSALKDSHLNAKETKKWKEAFEKSEKENKKLASSLKVTIKRNETFEKDQAIKLKNFEKKSEMNLTKQLSKNNEKAAANIKKFKAEREKIEKVNVDSKKKLDSLNKESLKLISELKEAKAKISSMAKVHIIKEPSNNSQNKKTDIDKKVVSKVQPSISLVKGQSKRCEEQKDKSLKVVIEKLIKGKFRKDDVLRQITSVFEMRSTAESKKMELKRLNLLDTNPKEKIIDKAIQKCGRNTKEDSESEDHGFLCFDVKKVTGDNVIQNLITFLFSFKEERAKLALETLMMFALHKGVNMKARLLEDEGRNIILTENENYSSRSGNIQKQLHPCIFPPPLRQFPVKLVIRSRRCYSTDDISWVPLKSSQSFKVKEPYSSSQFSDRELNIGMKVKLNEEVNASYTPNLRSSQHKMLTNSTSNVKSASIDDLTDSPLTNLQKSIPNSPIKSSTPITSHPPFSRQQMISNDSIEEIDQSCDQPSSQTTIVSNQTKSRRIADKRRAQKLSPTKSLQSQSTQSKPKITNSLKKTVNFIKNPKFIPIDQKSPVSSLLLEEEFLITASAERSIRFYDLESYHDKLIIQPKLFPEPIRKITFCMQDNLLYVALQKSIKIFDIRCLVPIFELKPNGKDPSPCINDFVTTMDRNILYVACGFDILAWDMSSNKIIGELQRKLPVNSQSFVASICYGIRKNKIPFLLTCNRTKTIKVFDNPESVWSKLDAKNGSSFAEKHIYKRYQFEETKDTCLKYDHNSPIAAYEGMFFLATNTKISRWNVDSMISDGCIFTNRAFNGVENKNLADINNMITHPHEPLLITSCRKGSIMFWDPIKLKPFSRNNCFAQHTFPYEKNAVSKLSCNSRMLATTNLKSKGVTLWNIDFSLSS